MLRTDPTTGNIQSLHRFGRQLRTDPDLGEGYSYHVNPGGFPVWAGGYPGAHLQSGYVGGAGLQSGVVPASFDWTSGLRNYGSPQSVTRSEAILEQADVSRTLAPGMAPDAVAPQEWAEVQSGAVNRSGLSTEVVQLYHQPLIQIKMRVVEVDRSDGVAIGSILEYVSRDDVDPSLTSGQTANRDRAQGYENLRSLSRLLLPNGLETAAAGTGSILNLTSEHINWLVQGLATELSADVITAPEVVTLNGQNVEFVSGDKLPFQLGQNTIVGSNNNIQQVFYKHVGTMVSVTPRIVNWGYHGEGRGQASIQANEILSWKALIEVMKANGITRKPGTDSAENPVDISMVLDSYKNQLVVPFSAQEQILLALNNYSKNRIELLTTLVKQDVITQNCCNRCRSWQPNDCTIDLSVVVRLSDRAGAGKVPDPDKANLGSSVEANVRAVANVIQVTNGHGVVMAGLIGEREIEDETKVPVLGDIPYVGALFRSRAVSRGKTEVLIFIEAEVLDSDPNVARAQSSEDFLLGQPYVDDDLLANPLEVGMHRIGFGSYLPPHSKHEAIYWEKHCRKVRKVRSHLSDIVKP